MFREVGIVTLLSCVIAVIAAVVGGAVVVFGDPGALTFDAYLKAMAGFVAGLGLLGIGRGIHLGARDQEISRAKRDRAHV
jgi:hypothetical protein